MNSIKNNRYFGKLIFGDSSKIKAIGNEIKVRNISNGRSVKMEKDQAQKGKYGKTARKNSLDILFTML